MILILVRIRSIIDHLSGGCILDTLEMALRRRESYKYNFFCLLIVAICFPSRNATLHCSDRIWNYGHRPQVKKSKRKISEVGKILWQQIERTA